MYDPRPIKIHTDDDFAKMRIAGRLAAETLDYITPFVEPHVSTGHLDKLCHDFIIEHDAVPAPLNYRGFPKSICTSINHVICHGIPSDDKKLKNGDIVNIDVTVIVDGWYGDTSRMFWVGDKIPLKAQKLTKTTYDSMMAGIEVVKPGKHTGDIGNAIQVLAEKKRYSVVRDFCGHGLGQVFHDAPNILHYGRPNTGNMLKKGMFFTIEPMINIGTRDAHILPDGWTAITKDKSLSAQFEHSLGVTDKGFEIFTLSPKGWHYPPYE